MQAGETDEAEVDCGAHCQKKESANPAPNAYGETSKEGSRTVAVPGGWTRPVPETVQAPGRAEVDADTAVAMVVGVHGQPVGVVVVASLCVPLQGMGAGSDVVPAAGSELVGAGSVATGEGDETSAPGAPAPPALPLTCPPFERIDCQEPLLSPYEYELPVE